MWNKPLLIAFKCQGTSQQQEQLLTLVPNTVPGREELHPPLLSAV